MDNETIIRTLAAIADVWGGALLDVTPEVYDGFARCRGFSHAPASNGDLGVLYYERLVVYVAGSAPDIDPSSIVHEMGHVFACKRSPNRCKEFGFFGWEYALCQSVGVTHDAWVKANRKYQVGTSRNGYSSLEDLQPEKVERVIQTAIRHATRHGLIGDDGVPRSIRSEVTRRPP
jgi:hypothetical protein